MKKFSVVVLGTGGIGSAALLHLARQGGSVLGIDRAQPPHDLGSSHGRTRLIRRAYFEHPDYVPLLTRAFKLWREVEDESAHSLLENSGVLQIGPETGEVLQGIRSAAARHQLDVEEVSATEVEKRWPALRVPSDCSGILEKCAGILRVEACVQAHLDLAVRHGAQLRAPCTVERWEPGRVITLHTSEGTIQTERLVVTAGAWAGPSLPDLDLKLQVLRKSVFWFEPLQSFSSQQYPGFLYELPQGVFYGFPVVDEFGLKVAEHSGGQTVEDPLRLEREVDAADEQRVGDFLASWLPGLTGKLIEHQVCMYTMSPDGHFIVDRHPAYENVTVAVGLSGHGFKFAPVLGQALAELSLNGHTDLPIDFLSLKRFG